MDTIYIISRCDENNRCLATQTKPAGFAFAYIIAIVAAVLIILSEYYKQHDHITGIIERFAACRWLWNVFLATTSTSAVSDNLEK